VAGGSMRFKFNFSCDRSESQYDPWRSLGGGVGLYGGLSSSVSVGEVDGSDEWVATAVLGTPSSHPTTA
jgi:hypothetical protein